LAEERSLWLPIDHLILSFERRFVNRMTTKTTLVVTDALGQAWPGPIAGLTVGTLGTGTGLTGDYYSDMTNDIANYAGQPTLTRVDPTVDFNWGPAQRRGNSIAC
jgi:hypothetical protein